MAFTVEDGTGVKGANSYVTTAFFKDYFKDRPEDAPVANTDIQPLLVAATRYIDNTFRLRFKGQRQRNTLLARSTLTVTANPADTETVTFGSNTYTFKTTPVADQDVEIGDTAEDSLVNLAAKIAEIDTDDYQGSWVADEDVSAIGLFTLADGVTTTETLANGSFDVAATIGESRHRQPLEFPRQNLRDSENQLIDDIPYNLKAACCEYAFRQNTAALAPDPTIDASGRPVVESMTKVGPIETKTVFASDNTPGVITKPYPIADRLLNEYLQPAGGAVRN